MGQGAGLCPATLGCSIDPGKAAEAAKDYKRDGYTAQKWFFRHGPSDGKDGLAKNFEMAVAVFLHWALVAVLT